MESSALLDEDSHVRWWRVALISLFTVLGVSLAALTWDASIEARNQEADYEFKDNKLEKQRAGLNKYLIVGFSLFALMGMVGLVFGQSRKLPLFKPWVLVPLLFWVWCGISFAWSVELGLSIRRIGHLFMTLAGGFGICALLNRYEVVWMAIVSMFSLVTIGLATELVLGTFEPWRNGYRFCGMGHPNETGFFAAILCLAARVLMLMQPQDSEPKLLSTKNIALLLILYGIGIILITKSRTTLASLIVALVLIQLTTSTMRNAISFLATGAGVASILGIFVAVARTSTSGTLFSVAAIGRSSHVSSLTGRLPLWEEILKWVERKPIFGHGYGAYWTTRRVEDFAQMFYWEPPNGHSIYIDSLVEVGLIGFLLMVCALIVCNVAGLTTYFRLRDSSLLFSVGIFNLAVVHGLTESSFFKGVFGPLCWSVAVFALLRARSEEEIAADEEDENNDEALPFYSPRPEFAELGESGRG